MPNAIRHPDLVARALGELCESERLRVDEALRGDPDLRHRFEQISGHLLQYEHLPQPPPPPPFERLVRDLDADLERAAAGGPAPSIDVRALPALKRRGDPVRSRRWAVVSGAAAALLLALVVWAPWQGGRRESAFSMVAGAGIELWRNGAAVPAPVHARVELRSGDVLQCRSPAEARLGDRVRLVLDSGARLRVDRTNAVALQAGRAWFEVKPSAAASFRVDTVHGAVHVLGTIFEVDVRQDRLAVSVERGRVRAEGVEIGAGERLREGVLASHPQRPGDWFRRPLLRIEAPGEPPHQLADPLLLRLVFSNPGHVALHMPQPGTARTALWLSFETPEGNVVREMPVLEAQVVAGLELLRPGSGLTLAAGQSKVITLKILPPVGSPGAYRCRALYRPEGQQPVLSSPLAFEVR